MARVCVCVCVRESLCVCLVLCCLRWGDRAWPWILAIVYKPKAARSRSDCAERRQEPLVN
jgi:hypothetical protein